MFQNLKHCCLSDNLAIYYIYKYRASFRNDVVSLMLTFPLVFTIIIINDCTYGLLNVDMSLQRALKSNI